MTASRSFPIDGPAIPLQSAVVVSLPVMAAVAGALLLWAPPAFAVITILAIGITAIVAPETAILALLPLAALDVYLNGIFVSQLCVGAVCAGALIHLYWSGKRPVFDRFYLLPALLLCSCLVPLAFAFSKSLVLKYCLKFAGLVAVFVLARLFCGSRRFIRRFIAVLAIAASVTALCGIAQAISQGPVLWVETLLNLSPVVSTLGEASIFRPYGTFRYVLEFALFLHMSACVLLAWVFAGRQYAGKWMVRLAAATVTFGLVMTFARGAWAAFAISLVVALTWVFRKRRLVLVAVCACVLAAGAYALTLDMTDVTGSVADVSVDVARFQLWAEGAHVIAENPMLGVGPGNLQFAIPPVLLWGELQPATSLENMYLTWMAQSGIPAAIVLVIFFVWLVGSGLKGWESNAPREVRAVQLGIAIALLGVMVNGMTDPILHSSQSGTLLFLLCGMQRAFAGPGLQDASLADKKIAPQPI